MPNPTLLGPDKYLLISSISGLHDYELYDTLNKAVDIATDMALGDYGQRCQYYACWRTDRFGVPVEAVAGFDAMVKETMGERSAPDHSRALRAVVL
jgi:hypothetical protein